MNLRTFTIKFRLSIFLIGVIIGYSQSLFGQTCKAKDFELQEVADHLNCLPLQNGAEVVIADSTGKSPTNIERSFILKKKDASTFQVFLNLRFVENNFIRQTQSLVSGKENTAEKAMRDKVSGCLKKYESRLTGPNGQRLELHLSDRNSQNPNHKRIETIIEIGAGEKFQTTSLSYNKEADCVVIIHEVLHRLGIVDEYLELRDKLADGNVLNSRNCRIQGSATSIMNDLATTGEKEFMNRTPMNAIAGEVCTCKNNNGCKEPPNATCDHPSYIKQFRKSEFNPKIVTDEQAKGLLSANFSMGMMQAAPRASTILNYKIIKYDVPEESILLPAYFRMITQPLCTKSNHKYITCAKRSNTGSHGHKHAADQSQCEPAPDFCLTGEWLQ